MPFYIPPSPSPSFRTDDKLESRSKFNLNFVQLYSSILSQSHEISKSRNTNYELSGQGTTPTRQQIQADTLYSGCIQQYIVKIDCSVIHWLIIEPWESGGVGPAVFKMSVMFSPLALQCDEDAAQLL